MKSFKINNTTQFTFVDGEIFGIECDSTTLHELSGAGYALDAPECNRVTLTNGDSVTRAS